ncbi:unnamed protein product [Protopolystoma xenopodis]|uniref:Protein quiver n=1 Tax=Protopolystoma xenopodis TaxID=117903 RepID=A0A3S5AHG6_9PLAT|nr:unnamed protein product [Protopolystoma xenopodis]
MVAQFNQFINGSKEPDTRIYRSCSHVKAAPGYECINRVGASKLKMRYCLCTDELCNSSPPRNVATVGSFLMLAAVTVTGLRYQNTF